MPRRLGDQHIAAVVGLLDCRAGINRTPAAHVEAGDGNRRVPVIRRAAWKPAAGKPADAEDLRALVLPLAVLDPKSSAVAVLNVQGVDVHIAFVLLLLRQLPDDGYEFSAGVIDSAPAVLMTCRNWLLLTRSVVESSATIERAPSGLALSGRHQLQR